MADPLTDESAGTLLLGGDLKVRRLGFGAMRITGEGIWGPPPDPEENVGAVRIGLTVEDLAELDRSR